MLGEDALDLAMIDPPIWWIKVDDTVYGPYTFGQMRSFVPEERLVQSSLVARGHEDEFLRAEAHELLSNLFISDEGEADANTPPARFIIILRSKGETRRGLIEALNTFGVFTEPLPGIFLLQAATSVAILQKTLAQLLDPEARLMVANAESGRLAWLGLGHEADSHIRAVWDK